MSIILDRDVLDGIVMQVEQQDKFFNNKACLDTLSYPKEIIGRQREAKELVEHLLGYKKGFVVPLVSVYGKSGSGKSATVRCICEGLDGISSCLVNLREARSIFGFENLILTKLGQPSMNNAHGISLVMSKIEDAIVSELQRQGKNFLVLVLDEFDQIFCNKRENPSDFVYKLLVLEENLKKRGLLMTLVCISNNGLSEYELDGRVRSRIGSSEIFFMRYTKSEVIEILGARAKEAFFDKIDDSVLEHCAEINSLDHGDARYAIDLLRKAAEIAAQKGEAISKSHVDKGSDYLQKDRIVRIVLSAPYHFRMVCLGLARISYLRGESWHSTSTIYRQYWNLIPKDKEKVLGYRRISEILREIKDSGIAVSETSSHGRKGWGTSYKLTIPPEMLGSIIGKTGWGHVVNNKAQYEKHYKSLLYYARDARNINDNHQFDVDWKNYVFGKEPEWEKPVEASPKI
jgi:archaeal cell division control protein 6